MTIAASFPLLDWPQPTSTTAESAPAVATATARKILFDLT
jgi:hypothetical protein